MILDTVYCYCFVFNRRRDGAMLGQAKEYHKACYRIANRPCAKGILSTHKSVTQLDIIVYNVT